MLIFGDRPFDQTPKPEHYATMITKVGYVQTGVKVFRRESEH